jgi:hypothetical protein
MEMGMVIWIKLIHSGALMILHSNVDKLLWDLCHLWHKSTQSNSMCCKIVGFCVDVYSVLGSESFSSARSLWFFRNVRTLRLLMLYLMQERKFLRSVVINVLLLCGYVMLSRIRMNTNEKSMKEKQTSSG